MLMLTMYSYDAFSRIGCQSALIGLCCVAAQKELEWAAVLKTLGARYRETDVKTTVLL